MLTSVDSRVCSLLLLYHQSALQLNRRREALLADPELVLPAVLPALSGPSPLTAATVAGLFQSYGLQFQPALTDGIIMVSLKPQNATSLAKQHADLLMAHWGDQNAVLTQDCFLRLLCPREPRQLSMRQVTNMRLILSEQSEYQIIVLLYQECKSLYRLQQAKLQLLADPYFDPNKLAFALGKVAARELSFYLAKRGELLGEEAAQLVLDRMSELYPCQRNPNAIFFKALSAGHTQNLFMGSLQQIRTPQKRTLEEQETDAPEAVGPEQATQFLQLLLEQERGIEKLKREVFSQPEFTLAALVGKGTISRAKFREFLKSLDIHSPLASYSDQLYDSLAVLPEQMTFSDLLTAVLPRSTSFQSLCYLKEVPAPRLSPYYHAPASALPLLNALFKQHLKQSAALGQVGAFRLQEVFDFLSDRRGWFQQGDVARLLDWQRGWKLVFARLQGKSGGARVSWSEFRLAL